MADTQLGKEHALQKLHERREKYASLPPIDNSKLPAGSLMYFPCMSCGAHIAVAEDYTSKPDLCSECEDLASLGWLE
jgi:hypothetical protein